MLALIAYYILIDTQEAVLAFTHPEGMEIGDRLSHWKCGEAPLPMHLLHKAKTCLKFGL
jgi:hypothetical protein